MLNFFDLFNKELLHKLSEIQWNITGTLPGKLKRIFFLGFILQDITPWNHKNVRNCYFGGYFGGPEKQCGIPWFFMILWISESFSLCLLVKNSFNFKLGFFTYFEYISGGIIRKNILCSDYHGARWYQQPSKLLVAKGNCCRNCFPSKNYQRQKFAAKSFFLWSTESLFICSYL